MSECDRCGGEVDNKNNAGHYRDKCWDCIEAVAAEADPIGHEALWERHRGWPLLRGDDD